jgi:hypothetical protein
MMQISKGNLFLGFLLEACPAWLPSHQTTIITPTYYKTCQELIFVHGDQTSSFFFHWLWLQANVLCFLRKPQIENHQPRVFQRHQRPARFHERPAKNQQLERRVLEFFKIFEKLRFYTKNRFQKISLLPG